MACHDVTLIRRLMTLRRRFADIVALRADDAMFRQR